MIFLASDKLKMKSKILPVEKEMRSWIKVRPVRKSIKSSFYTVPVC